MEEEDHFTQTLLPLLSHIAAQGSRAAALGNYSLFLSSRISLCKAAALGSYSLFLSSRISLLFSSLLKLCCSLLVLIYRQEWCHNSSSCSTMVVAKVNGWCRPFAAH
jgi:hypothetical protein